MNDWAAFRSHQTCRSQRQNILRDNRSKCDAKWQVWRLSNNITSFYLFHFKSSLKKHSWLQGHQHFCFSSCRFVETNIDNNNIVVLLNIFLWKTCYFVFFLEYLIIIWLSILDELSSLFLHLFKLRPQNKTWGINRLRFCTIGKVIQNQTETKIFQSFLPLLPSS